MTAQELINKLEEKMNGLLNYDEVFVSTIRRWIKEILEDGCD